MTEPKLKKFIVKSWWYSEQEVEAKTREEAEQLGIDELPHLDMVTVERVRL